MTRNNSDASPEEVVGSYTNGHAGGSESDEDDGLHMAEKQRVARAYSEASSYEPSTLNGDGAGETERERPGRGREGKSRMRHGWDSQLDTLEQATLLNEKFYIYFEDLRHDTAAIPPADYHPRNETGDWRMKDRLKTVSAILALCLNVGVDPPDVLKTNPCAKLECWVEPVLPDNTNQSASNNSNAQIGKNLQVQYENLSLRTRYKVILDPTTEELKRYCTSLRKNAHAERILFHYNGHGVPKPTQSGEIWCFNRSYTQYIPIGLYDLQEWVGAPGLYVWDCSAAGGIIAGSLAGMNKHIQNQQEAMRREPGRAQQSPSIRWEDTVHLAACREDEVLPTNPDMPADMFTSCLTTPIKMAVRFFMLQNPLRETNGITPAQACDIPGKVSERRTPLGELNWIFTAITDTIAWNRLDKPLFKKLFRQDLMIAALFRNFLLAQRVMRKYHCRPQSYPQIPDTHDHPLWESWDLAVEMILAQLPSLNAQQKYIDKALENQPTTNGNTAVPPQIPELTYTHSDFFSDQLSAFEVYLNSAPSSSSLTNHPKPPEQLPIVLQVLLSQVHRLRALILLSKFLDLGPWAVNLALSIGIFPYVLKLLQSQAIELKPPMVFIWARILAVDQTIQADLLKDTGFSYFTNILSNASGIPAGNAAEHRAMCAFVISMLTKDFMPGKQAVLNTTPNIIESCLDNLDDAETPLLRQFSLLCIGNLWRDYPVAKEVGLSIRAPSRIGDRTHDPVPEVRAACLDALTSFIATGEPDEAMVAEEETLASLVLSVAMDGSIMVRRELTVFYSTFIKRYEPRFLVAAWEQLAEERDKKVGLSGVEPRVPPSYMDGVHDPASQDSTASTSPLVNGHLSGHQRGVSATPSEIMNGTGRTHPGRARAQPKALSQRTIYRAIWRQALSMSADPHPDVAKNAGIIVDYVIGALLDSELADDAHEMLNQITNAERQERLTLATLDGLTKQRSRETRPETPPSPSSTITRPDGYFSGLSRTASIAAAMKNLVWGGNKTPHLETPPSPTRSTRGPMYQERQLPYRSRPLAPQDAAQIAPDALDKIVGPAHQPQAKVPPTPNHTARDLSKAPTIPLQSTFFAWSSTYFREPQMRPPEADEPGSIYYNERMWRRNRNDKIIAATQPLKELAGRQRWDVPCGYFGIGAAPVKMVFHQFENHLITSDDRDSIAVWDWKEERQLCRFSNANPPGSRVTELRFINEDDRAMLMTGSSDGVVKIFKNYADKDKIELATSFRALSDLVPSDSKSAGLVFDWQQGTGRILVAGDDRVIRVWHAGHELCTADIYARSSSCITSLTSDQVEGNIFVAGFGNGNLRVFDQRLPENDAMVREWGRKRDCKDPHKSWIVGVHLQRGGLRELVSAESNGGVRLWDIRLTDPVHSLPGKHQPRNLRSLSVHEHAPVFATGGADHTIRVYSTRTSLGAGSSTSGLRHLSSAEPYMSFMRLSGGSRNAPITATAFHPHRLMLATGAVNDGHVNLFRCDTGEGGGSQDRG